MNYFCGERTKDSPKAHFLGREIKEEASLQLHQQLLWLTYRKNIPITASLHSDVGWGCLIRVAQMAWAHSLQRHFSMLQKRVERNYIITPFQVRPAAVRRKGTRSLGHKTRTVVHDDSGSHHPRGTASGRPTKRLGKISHSRIPRDHPHQAASRHFRRNVLQVRFEKSGLFPMSAGQQKYEIVLLPKKYSKNETRKHQTHHADGHCPTGSQGGG